MTIAFIVGFVIYTPLGLEGIIAMAPFLCLLLLWLFLALVSRSKRGQPASPPDHQSAWARTTPTIRFFSLATSLIVFLGVLLAGYLRHAPLVINAVAACLVSGNLAAGLLFLSGRYSETVPLSGRPTTMLWLASCNFCLAACWLFIFCMYIHLTSLLIGIILSIFMLIAALICPVIGIIRSLLVPISII